ncbi:MAG: threonylcarbamoyl-AMP synthase [Candidatus Iainarchaeum archaeon]|uniref:L-threonylcarbamoyladenylate synthase n=1 Tax=Candidatus Iainarchaeum sp. TaxID=3101447 RepID=A0A7T9DKB0_9ARCH|nr:MAG: threonylcarbamoyl-AMP synthase [Candidatus Diapherotrites archaeon]
MMTTIPWKEVTAHHDEIIRAMRAGKIFIYPTDTIYGIGCAALDAGAVKRIRALKSREIQKPFSVIAPSKDWIHTHFGVRFPEFLEKLPGPFTFILPKKVVGFLREVAAGESVGVRIPKHPFTQLVEEAGIPFVTTSVNISGQPHAKSISDIPKEMREAVDYVVDAGKLENPPSEIWDLSGEAPKHIPRKN